MSHHDGTERTDTTTEKLISDKLARDVACSLILQGHQEAPFGCIMAYQNKTRRIWEVLYEPYNATRAFGKAALYSSLARSRHTGRTIQEYVAK